MTEDDFRAMTFESPVELFATGNPDFFTGTVIESGRADLTTGENPQPASRPAASRTESTMDS